MILKAVVVEERRRTAEMKIRGAAEGLIEGLILLSMDEIIH